MMERREAHEGGIASWDGRNLHETRTRGGLVDFNMEYGVRLENTVSLGNVVGNASATRESHPNNEIR